MSGLGVGEALLIGLIVGFIGLVILAGLFGLRGLRPRKDPGDGREVGAGVLEELRLLSRRLDALEERLTRAGIQGVAGGGAAGFGEDRDEPGL